MSRKFFWLKLRTGFFNQLKLKKLRREEDGDRLLVVYIKILLLSVPDEGKIVFEGLEPTLADELALSLDEDPEDVQRVLDFLDQYNLIEEIADDEFLLLEAAESIGSETDSAERMRRFRKRQASQCDTSVTNSDVEIDIEPDIEIDKTREEPDCTLCAPDWLDVHGFFFSQGIRTFSAEDFIKQNEERGWRIDGEPIRDWKALAVSWDKKKKAEIEKGVLGNDQFGV